MCFAQLRQEFSEAGVDLYLQSYVARVLFHSFLQKAILDPHRDTFFSLPRCATAKSREEPRANLI